VPVWHEGTQRWRENKDLVVIGITQEQHPDRCQLFAQWQGFEWPILWDPLNLTGSNLVPALFAIDEYGIVRGNRWASVEQFEKDFMYAGFEDPGRPPVSEAPTNPVALHADPERSLHPEANVRRAYAQLLWGREDDLNEAVRLLEDELEADDPAPELWFRAGVAYRMRYDSPHSQPSVFQTSLDYWTRALVADPNQYIWRRRIQQYGPRLDKPYPFYNWVERAEAEITERGETPVKVRVPLTGAEIASPTNVLPQHEQVDKSPDAKREILTDSELVTIETATAVHTGTTGGRVRTRPTARVHIALRPNAERDVHWSNDAGPTVAWISIPKDWMIESSLYTLDMPDTESSNEVRRFDFEVVPPEEIADNPRLRGYVLYYVCEGESGECVYRRQDFVIPLAGGPAEPGD